MTVTLLYKKRGGLMTLDVVLKIAQICFYIIISIITVATYISAKDTLLNTVNTEYKKLVMERLKELSHELLSEFDFNSNSFLAKNLSILSIIENCISQCSYNQELIRTGNYTVSIPWGEDAKRLLSLATQVKSDPFIPKKLRDQLHSFFEKRCEKLVNTREEVIREYLDKFAKGECQIDQLDKYQIANDINARLQKSNADITKADEEAQNLRLKIKTYLESFDPIKSADRKICSILTAIERTFG